MEAYVKRDTYLNRLIVRKDNGLVKAITGPRRAGKSFLLNPIFKDYLIGQGAVCDKFKEMLKEKHEELNIDDLSKTTLLTQFS